MDIINELLSLYQKYNNVSLISGNGPLVGVSCDEIHVTPEFLREHFPNIIEQPCGEHHTLLRADVCGVPFVGVE